ncbi:MAG: tetratricopeptide repeat protein [Planctomycetes bacterium]|nr:tetratricopeptide repeat protein [Planctomycetota bacterium]
MKLTGRTLAMIVVAAGCLYAAGCNGEKKIAIQIPAPATMQIPENIKQIGVWSSFKGTGQSEADNKKWGEYAANTTYSLIDNNNKKYPRYNLTDQKNMKTVSDANDLNAALGGTVKADASKWSDAQAYITGDVKVEIKDDKEHRSFSGGYMASFGTSFDVRKVRCTVSVSATMVNASTLKPMATLPTTTKSFNCDSKEDKERYGGKVPEASNIVGDLIEDQVKEFVAMIMKHDQDTTLAASPSKNVDRGNKLAVAGDYKDALEAYNAAIAENPADHAAHYNAGVCNEALGNLQDAFNCYDKAFKINAEERYAQARKRVKP